MIFWSQVLVQDLGKLGRKSGCAKANLPHTLIQNNSFLLQPCSTVSSCIKVIARRSLKKFSLARGNDFKTPTTGIIKSWRRKWISSSQIEHLRPNCRHLSRSFQLCTSFLAQTSRRKFSKRSEINSFLGPLSQRACTDELCSILGISNVFSFEFEPEMMCIVEMTAINAYNLGAGAQFGNSKFICAVMILLFQL